MLVLTRKAGESVVIGENIRIKVIEICPGTVRLGFEAPHEVSIYREEIQAESTRGIRSGPGVVDPT